ncbi:TetR/AcrR family transcriptional regulator [Rhizorhabdus histidinilytica]|uniref:Transcriptional regulator, TetR family n=1 Tax=Rhizorhabdus histidinilytica TaxID=439228 RepID=A0A1T5ELZ4_9SPHN|nr:TetR/AcrR family transcriptional regulator [Rhizorhabdus histidinilytica]SKB84977.1 transcriptional regulator, TetR family [Rhizorhabdus histidinilytica]
MVQVKKEAVRQRIIETADRLFHQKGFIATTIGQIAKDAQMAGSAIYVYFPSKLDIALAIFEPRIIAEMDVTEKASMRIKDKRARLAYILKRLWHDIPLQNNNYFNNLIQALVISSNDENYKPTILLEIKTRIGAMIGTCLSPERAAAFDIDAFTQLAVMAFDGFVINGHLNPAEVGSDRIIDLTCSMILGGDG